MKRIEIVAFFVLAISLAAAILIDLLRPIFIYLSSDGFKVFPLIILSVLCFLFIIAAYKVLSRLANQIFVKSVSSEIVTLLSNQPGNAEYESLRKRLESFEYVGTGVSKMLLFILTLLWIQPLLPFELGDYLGGSYNSNGHVGPSELFWRIFIVLVGGGSYWSLDRFQAQLRNSVSEIRSKITYDIKDYGHVREKSAIRINDLLLGSKLISDGTYDS